MNCKKCKAKLKIGSMICPECGADNTPTNCRKCHAMLKKGSTVCPKCGKNNAAIQPWMKIVAVIVALALLAALGYGLVRLCNPRENNIFYKDSYTANTSSSYKLKKFQKKMDTVIATMGDASLTNGQLQVYYWMEARLYTVDAKTYGWDVPDLDTSFDSQIYDSETGKTWQQYFLEEALNTWQEYTLLTLEAETAGFEMPERYRAELDNAEADLTDYASRAGYDSLEAYLHARLGEGARLQDYLDYLEGYYTSTLYSKELGKQQNIADAEIESYFEENAEALSSEYAISKDSGNAVDVRLILIELEGGTEDEYGNITYSNEDWNTCYQEALALYEQWKSGDADEDSFAALSEDENLTTDILPGELADAVEDWCFDESRQSGDHRMIKTDDGYYLVYYVDGEAAWIRYSRNGIIDIRLAEIVEALASENPFTADFTSIALGTVDLS